MKDNKAQETESKEALVIRPPNMKTVIFKIRGTAPLVQHRFSAKTQNQMKQKMEEGSTTRKGKNREPVDMDEMYNNARYVSKEGWDGFNASSIRCAMVRACSLVGYKMTLAKMSFFVIQDGWDAKQPEIPLIRIIGEPRKMEMIGKVETGQPYVCVRPCYDEWKAEVCIKYDADLFKLEDVANLMSRVGCQVGIGEGRPSSPNSSGMGWGTFTLEDNESSAPLKNAC